MIKKLFPKKETAAPTTVRNESANYHTCISTCDADKAALKAEAEAQRSDNTKLIARVGVLDNQVTELRKDLASSDAKVESLDELLGERDETITDLNERIAELEKRLSEADEKADGTPVKYASARKTMTKAKLAQLRKSLEDVPEGARGFGGSVTVYDKKTKRLSVVQLTSKEQALEVLGRAEKGNVEIVL
jgi:chromosome segregation ATPase